MSKRKMSKKHLQKKLAQLKTRYAPKKAQGWIIYLKLSKYFLDRLKVPKETQKKVLKVEQQSIRLAQAAGAVHQRMAVSFPMADRIVTQLMQDINSLKKGKIPARQRLTLEQHEVGLAANLTEIRRLKKLNFDEPTGIPIPLETLQLAQAINNLNLQGILGKEKFAEYRKKMIMG